MKQIFAGTHTDAILDYETREEVTKATTTLPVAKMSKKHQKQHLCKCNTLFLYISLPSLQDYHVKIPEATFYGGRWIFLSPTRLGFSPQEFNLNTGYGPEEFSSRKFAYIWPSDGVGIIAMKIERKQIHFYVAFSLLSPIAIRGS